jgi:GT2 family glycosyltransferase
VGAVANALAASATESTADRGGAVKPLLSVVVPTYQRRESVLRLLRALAGPPKAPYEYEVVLSIDGSSDGTREAAEAFDAPFPLRIIYQENRGRAAACNAGARVAAGDVLAFLDDDMEPATDFVRGHVEAHPPGVRRAVVGPAPIPAGPDSPPLVVFRSVGFGAKLARLAQPGYQPVIRDVYCGNFSVQQALFWEVGGFDEDFIAYGHEDFDLILRLQAAGCDLTFAPDALAVQHYEKRVAALARNIEEEGQTAVIFAMKHPEILEQLELGTWMERSFRHRFALTTLVAVSRVLPAISRAAVRIVEGIERRRPTRLNRYYGRLFEYLFWLGAERSLRDLGMSPGWRVSPRRGLAAIAASRRQQLHSVDQGRMEPPAGTPAARASSNAE